MGAKAELGWGDAAQRGLGATAELQPKLWGFGEQCCGEDTAGSICAVLWGALTLWG